MTAINLALPSWAWWLVAVLAIWRATRLVTLDYVIERPRLWLTRKSDGIGYFLSCPWCVGFWLAVGFAVLVATWPLGASWVALVGSWSAVAGLLSERLN